MADDFTPSPAMQSLIEGDAAAMANTNRMMDVILGALEGPQKVVRLNTPFVDDVDRAYVVEQFSEIVDLIERLPRTIRVFVRQELSDDDKQALDDMAGRLQLISAKYAPAPKDAA